MDNLTPKLTSEQLKQNIDALQAQQVSNDKIQQYIDNYQSDGIGGYALKTTQTSSTTPSEPQSVGSSLLGKVWSGLSNFSRNFVSGASNQLTKMGANTLDEASNRPLIGIGPFGIKAPKVNTPEFSQTVDIVSPVTGAGGTAGKVYAEALPYIVGGEASSQTANSLKTITKDLPSAIGAIIRVGSRAITGGATTYEATKIATGDEKQAQSAAKWGGALEGTFATLGETARAFKIDQKLMRQFFDDTKENWLKSVNGRAAKDLERENPELFKEYVDKGIIKVQNGQVVVNESRAAKALEAGFSGSIDTMGETAVKNGWNYESQVRNLAETSKDIVTVPNKNELSVTLEEIANQYKNTATPFNGRWTQGKIVDVAGQFAEKVKAGTLTPQEAVDLRYLLDTLRKPGSFTPGASMSVNQGNLKTLSDSLRQEVNKIGNGEMGKIMEGYSDNFKFLQDLRKAAIRANNKDLVDRIDMTIGSLGVLSGNPVVEAVPFATKAFKSARLSTGIAQGIGGPMGTIAPTARSTTAAILSTPSQK